MAARRVTSEIRATEKTVSDQRSEGFVVCRKEDRRDVGAAGCVGVATKALGSWKQPPACDPVLSFDLLNPVSALPLLAFIGFPNLQSRKFLFRQSAALKDRVKEPPVLALGVGRREGSALRGGRKLDR